MSKTNKPNGNGDYTVTIRSYLTFLEALRLAIREYTDPPGIEDGCVLDKHVIGSCVKKSIEKSNRISQRNTKKMKD
jgi:hypothetical protein